MGVSDARKSVEEFIPPDLCLRECLRSTPEGSILGFLGLKNPLLRSMSGDFDDFPRKCPKNVPDPQIETAIRIESEKPSLYKEFWSWPAFSGDRKFQKPKKGLKEVPLDVSGLWFSDPKNTWPHRKANMDGWPWIDIKKTAKRQPKDSQKTAKRQPNHSQITLT